MGNRPLTLALLTGGIVLSRDDEKVDHSILIPHTAQFDPLTVAAELADLGLEMLDQDECPVDYVPDGVKVYLANIGGIETPQEAAA